MIAVMSAKDLHVVGTQHMRKTRGLPVADRQRKSRSNGYGLANAARGVRRTPDAPLRQEEKGGGSGEQQSYQRPERAAAAAAALAARQQLQEKCCFAVAIQRRRLSSRRRKQAQRAWASGRQRRGRVRQHLCKVRPDARAASAKDAFFDEHLAKARLKAQGKHTSWRTTAALLQGLETACGVARSAAKLRVARFSRATGFFARTLPQAVAAIRRRPARSLEHKRNAPPPPTSQHGDAQRRTERGAATAPSTSKASAMHPKQLRATTRRASSAVRRLTARRKRQRERVGSA